MRDIRFRVWNENLKEMIKDIHICPQYGWLVMSDNDAIAERGRVSEEDLIWMQYTGLKDKNGIEIYEGDILRDYGNDIEDWVVSYEYGKFVGTFDNICEDLYEIHDLEVIGNIYQNKKILEKEGK